MRSKNLNKWEEYQNLASVDPRSNFFDYTDEPNANHSHSIGGGNQVLRYILNKLLIETVIGDMLFHPDDVDGVTQQRALSIFKVLSDDIYDELASGRDIYTAEDNILKTIKLLAKNIDLCDSFRNVSSILQVILEVVRISEYGGSSIITI